MNEEFADNLESNIEEMPEEVSEFLASADFKILKTQILQNINKPEERSEFSNILMFFLYGSKTAEELDYYIHGLTIPQEKKDAIKKSIQQNIVDEILLLIEINEEFDQEENPSKSLAVTRTPFVPRTASASLTSLAERLRRPSVSSPRQYGLEKGNIPDNLPVTEPGAPTPAPYAAPMDTISEPMPLSEPVAAPAAPSSTPTKTFDPYHESIDK